MKKGSKIYSVLHAKCPRCQQGDLFTHANPYNLKHLTEMHENCPHCGLKYEVEPGFFYGGMYISYALTVAELLLLLAASLVLNIHLSMENSMLIVTTLMLILMPWNFRMGRAGWLSLFVKYRPGPGKEAARP